MYNVVDSSSQVLEDRIAYMRVENVAAPISRARSKVINAGHAYVLACSGPKSLEVMFEIAAPFWPAE